MTCDGNNPVLLFPFYGRPYDWESWSTTGCLVILITVLVGLICPELIPPLHFTLSTYRTLQILLFNISILLEMSHDFPPWVQKNVTMSRICRVMIGTWLLMAVILTNAYKGIVTSDLTSPIPITKKWSTFTGLVRYDLASLKLSYFLNGISEKSETLLNCNTDASQRVHMLWSSNVYELWKLCASELDGTIFKVSKTNFSFRSTFETYMTGQVATF